MGERRLESVHLLLACGVLHLRPHQRNDLDPLAARLAGLFVSGSFRRANGPFTGSLFNGPMDRARTHERYWLTYTFAVGLTAIVAGYGAWGWLAGDVAEPFKAILCLVAQGLANGNAVLARRAFSKERPLMALCALGLAFGCGAWSAISLHHAWTLDGSEIHWAMTVFLALLEPVMFWFVEEVKLAPAPVSASDLADQALAEHRAQSEPGRKRSLRLVAGGVTGAAALALSPAAAANDQPDPAPRTQRHVNRDDEPDRAQAKLLLAQGQHSAWRVHKLTGVPLSTCKRWARGEAAA